MASGRRLTTPCSRLPRLPHDPHDIGRHSVQGRRHNRLGVQPSELASGDAELLQCFVSISKASSRAELDNSLSGRTKASGNRSKMETDSFRSKEPQRDQRTHWLNAAQKPVDLVRAQCRRDPRQRFPSRMTLSVSNYISVSDDHIAELLFDIVSSKQYLLDRYSTPSRLLIAAEGQQLV